MEYGMLINYGLCTGCDTCEVSCLKEKGLNADEWGIKVQQIGPKKLGGAWEWDYVPVPSRLCDLCTERRAQGRPVRDALPGKGYRDPAGRQDRRAHGRAGRKEGHLLHALAA